MWQGGSAAYSSSILEPARLRSYAKKVARQAADAGVDFLPNGGDPGVWLVALAPAEGERTVSQVGSDQYVSLGHEGVVIGLRRDGVLVSDSYMYGKSWPLREAETFDPERVGSMRGGPLEFTPLDDLFLTYLDVGRDRWHPVHVPRYGSLIAKEVLDERRRPIVHAKGVGMSRALRDLYVRAGGTVR